MSSKSTFIYHFDRRVNVVVVSDERHVCVQFTDKNLSPLHYLGAVTNFPYESIHYEEYLDQPDPDYCGFMDFMANGLDGRTYLYIKELVDMSDLSVDTIRNSTTMRQYLDSRRADPIYGNTHIDVTNKVSV